ncbi:SdpI family protein [Bacillus sp. RG28]|uniref:SdpI family protein n=1 Tax=Gottfriedia endophytica TaxID=2820819 RepID=A0A940NSP0_9BACI|nr:SdpI family protein [Gottfriedia endophytica]MBP0724168.1 SdpI family protein [Gottfriedia endophytica]
MYVGIVIAFIIGLTFIITGLFLKHKPPKEINDYYGYRTFRSMKNIELWNEANQLSAKIMIKNGYIIMILGSIIGIGIGFKYEIVSVFLTIGLMGLLTILMFIKVEKRLKQLDR